jgi:F-type H+-transporting ATPase subunit c
MKRSTKSILTIIKAFAFLAMFGGVAFAQGADAAQMRLAGLTQSYGPIAIAAALGIGIAALGGSLGQGRAAAAALDGIARNPGAAGQIRGPMILGLALIESLVIYALIICLLLVLKVG